MRATRRVTPVLLAGLVAAAAASAASLAYEYAEGGHGAAGVRPSAFVLGVDALGVTLAVLFAIQLFAAYRLYAARPALQAALHRAIAAPLLVVVALHGGGATLHALRPPTETLPLWLVGIGLAGALGLAAQAGTGLLGRSRPALRVRHRTIIVVAAGVVVVHVALGAAHAVIG